MNNDKLHQRIVTALLVLQVALLGALLLRIRSLESQVLALSAARPAGQAAGSSSIVEGVFPGVSSAGAPALGPEDAPVTVVEFSSFGCSVCKDARPTLKSLLAKYPDRVRLAYRHFPAPEDPASWNAALAAACAQQQGAFWKMHDAIFLREQLAGIDFSGLAGELGLDRASFDACLAAEGTRKEVERDIAEGRKLGVDGTPTFFINGRKIPGLVPEPMLDQVVAQVLAEDGSKSREVS